LISVVYHVIKIIFYWNI